MGLREELVKTYELENLLISWAEPPSATEDQRCTNAVQVIKNAIDDYEPFKYKSIEVFAQGSYRNGTNVKAESDVDVCVRCMDVFFANYPQGMGDNDFGNSPATYRYSEFKNDVDRALRQYLGTNVVNRGNKAFDLHANSYRIDADVVPAFEHRRYDNFGNYISGTEIHPDNGVKIINWPHQNYENGVNKNKATGFRFKKLVRILKNVRHNMEANGMAAAKPIPSYLIECLVWNVPNDRFGNESYTDDLKNILLHLYSCTKDDAQCSEWGEINELKYLFRWQQPWTRQQAHEFVVAVWAYLGLQ
ncbi:nucleotidyltransferase [bacterium]|nr:nucleotidyltransferase [bacterium]